jgi:3-hydroxy acid dehydrogenase / malonic semialdehyde reductase
MIISQKKKMMNKIALITGATSGIGWATAVLLSNNGYDIIACGRREDKLNALKNELKTESICLAFDVRNQSEVKCQIDNLPEKWKKIEVLVNNAGNAHGLSSIQDGDIADWDAMIDINVKGLLYVTKAVLPLLSKGSKIVNIGSMAGKETYPNGNVYCASKFAVHALSESMRKDLITEGITVTNIAPGLVETAFSEVRFKGDKERAKQVYKGIDALKAEDIAETILFALNRPKHVNIAEILVMPSDQASSTIVNRKV